MAGHSKWANIKHRKGKQDAKRGKLYTKLIREITVSAKLGGGDVIDRAAKRGAGGLEGNDVEEIRYEGYGPAGVAVMVDCMTNNRNRTVAEVRHAFTKCGGNMGAEGSVAYLFKELGEITLAPGADEERVMEIALEAGADDIVVNDDKSIDLTISPDVFQVVKDAITKAGFQPVHAEVTMAADVNVPVTDKEIAEKLLKLTDMLEDLDDVQEVYTNADIAEEILADLD
jgi:YebC/PmpR family DNA-binding regulatory protein